MPSCTTGSARLLQALEQQRGCASYIFHTIFFFFLSGKSPALSETMWSLPVGPYNHQWRGPRCHYFDVTGRIVDPTSLQWWWVACCLVLITLHLCIFFFIFCVWILRRNSVLQKKKKKTWDGKTQTKALPFLFPLFCHSSCPKRMAVHVCRRLFVCALHKYFIIN